MTWNTFDQVRQTVALESIALSLQQLVKVLNTKKK